MANDTSPRSPIPDPRSPVAVTLFVLAFYLLFSLLAMVRHDWDPLWFTWIGGRFSELDINGSIGYDGQFVYYLARDGAEALDRLDIPVYRVQRILLPFLTALLSLGQPTIIAWLIPLINMAAVTATTYLLASWLKSESRSPWYALIYALYVGTLMAFSRDLTEPLALFLAALGAVLWLRNELSWAVVALALAALTKETMLLFALGIAAAELLGRKPKRALTVLASVIPLLFWELFLFATMGELPLLSGSKLELIPLKGILPQLTAEPGRLSALFLAGLPALILLPYGFWLLWRGRGRSAPAWWLVLNCLFVLFMPADVYDHIMHAGRNSGGLVLSFVFILPTLGRPLRLLSLGYWTIPTLIWFIPILRWAPWLSEV